MYSCKCLTKKDFFKYFKFLPVSINNLYGDPFFPSQIKNTFEKLSRLEEEGHQGVVSIITKSEISKEMALRLKSFSLNLVILVSISNLSYQIEKVSGNRYKTLFICNKLGIPAIGYIRPFIPNENTQKEKVEEMFSKIAEAGTRICIVSGLRGNDQILSDIHISKEDKHDWSLRVKTMPKEVKVYISEFKEKYSLFVFDRTSCGVSYALGLSHSYNPYYSSPQLAGCFSCPLKESCFDQQKTFVPEEKDIELAKVLGYQAKMVNLDSFELCTVQPHNRTSCVSCCTSCFKLKRAAIEITPFERICLGDIGLLRLLTKKLVFCKDLIDDGDFSIAQPKNRFLQQEDIYILNSWWSFSRNAPACYSCSYCIVPHYKNKNQEYGSSPIFTAKRLSESFLEQGGKFCDEN